MDTLVTGSEGFIGSHYCNYINHQAYMYDLQRGNDLKDTTLVSQLPDVKNVVHLAATNGTKLFYETPTEVSFNNTIPVFNLIQRYQHTNTKFIFASTCEIFNSTIDNKYYDVPTDENVPIMFNDITNPRWSYSIPKALGENLVANCGLPFIIIRYFNVYGPGQKDHFIQEFVERCKQGVYEIHGDDTRSFCYVEDAVRATKYLIDNDAATGHIINVGNSQEIKISEVAKTIMQIMGINKPLKIYASPKGSAKRRCPDTTKLIGLTGYSPRVNLYQGLKLTVESLL